MNFPLWYDLFLKILVIFIATGMLFYSFRHLLAKLKSLSPSHVWLRALGETLYTPVSWFIWTLGSIFMVEVIVREGTCPIPLDLYITGKNLFIVFAITWLLVLWKKKVAKDMLIAATQRSAPTSDKELIAVVGKLSTIAVLIVAGFMALDILDVPLQALLAFGGIGSLAITWAAKDVIANFFGGMMIFVNRPFVVGDWIRSPNKNFEGVVEEIGWYMTQIRTFERVPTFIPNAIITEAIIENPGRMYNRRIKHTFGIRYEDIDRVEVIVEKIEAMLKRHPEIDQNQFLFVHFIEFGSYSLNINIYTFTKTTRWAHFRSIQQDVLLKVSKIIEECGAKIAFPTQTVQLRSNNPPVSP